MSDSVRKAAREPMEPRQPSDRTQALDDVIPPRDTAARAGEPGRPRAGADDAEGGAAPSAGAAPVWQPAYHGGVPRPSPVPRATPGSTTEPAFAAERMSDDAERESDAPVPGGAAPGGAVVAGAVAAGGGVAADLSSDATSDALPSDPVGLSPGTAPPDGASVDTVALDTGSPDADLSEIAGPTVVETPVTQLADAVGVVGHPVPAGPNGPEPARSRESDTAVGSGAAGPAVQPHSPAARSQSPGAQSPGAPPTVVRLADLLGPPGGAGDQRDTRPHADSGPDRSRPARGARFGGMPKVLVAGAVLILGVVAAVAITRTQALTVAPSVDQSAPATALSNLPSEAGVVSGTTPGPGLPGLSPGASSSPGSTPGAPGLPGVGGGAPGATPGLPGATTGLPGATPGAPGPLRGGPGGVPGRAGNPVPGARIPAPGGPVSSSGTPGAGGRGAVAAPPANRSGGAPAAAPGGAGQGGGAAGTTVISDDDAVRSGRSGRGGDNNGDNNGGDRQDRSPRRSQPTGEGNSGLLSGVLGAVG